MYIIDGAQYSNWSRAIFQEMKAGGVTAVNVTTVYWENAFETLRVLGRWNQLFRDNGDLIIQAKSVEDIHRAKRDGRIGIIFGFQNCSPLQGEIDFVEIFYQLGVRFMQLTYNNQSLIGAGCYEEEDSGITRFGKQVIREMNRVGMIIDMSHSAERTTLDAIELSDKPITVSHANPTFWHPALRNKSNAILKALAQSNGMLGFSLYPFHLKDGPDCTLEMFCQMIADTVALMGVDHVGIGTDLCQDQPLAILEMMRNGRWTKEKDYGEGSASNAEWPRSLSWFRSNADFPNITQGLYEHGFSDEEVAKIMGGNWLSFFERTI